MKRIATLLIVMAMLLVMSTNVLALESEDGAKLSEGTDEEIVEFLDAYGVEIPGGIANLENWIEFIRETIRLVEDDPCIFFVYNFTVSQKFAESIQNAVLCYYGYEVTDTKSTYSVYTSRATNEYELQDSTVYRTWNSIFLNYNCYSHALAKTDVARDPGNISGTYHDSLPTLTTLKSCVQADLATLGYSCVNTTTTRPTSSTIPSGAKAICLRRGSSDYHFMRYTLYGWTHKPGNTQILLWNYASPGAKTWTNEHVFMDVAFEGDLTYNSTIYYFVYKTNHGDIISRYTGEHYHSGTSHYFLYQDVCEDCGDVYSTYYVSNDCNGPPCQTIHPNSITPVTNESE